MKRVQSIDIIRGLVMVIMALDHIRDMMHVNSITQQPTNLQTTTAALFMTRWVTHLCAPTFVFLSGVSAQIVFRKTADTKAARRFLFTRGVWLILLEFTVVNFALWFDIRFRQLILEVIAAIGFGFVVLSLLAGLSSRLLLIAGFVIVAGHNLLQAVSFPPGSTLNFLSSLFFRPNMFVLSPNFSFLVGYPLIPWLGIMLLGFGTGPLFQKPPEQRKKIFLRIGIAVLVFFVLLRFGNFYGDPAQWERQKSGLLTFLSFINVTKYPPSLLFDSLMLGTMFLFLSFAEGASNRLTRFLIVYGQVPLFYFILHMFLVHILMLAMLFLQGYSAGDMQFSQMRFGRPDGPSGLGLPGIYAVWLAVVLLMYPLCRWYGRYKSNHRGQVWLRYL